MWENLKKGDIVKIPLSHSDLVETKVRPALVLYHDLETRQLTVAYITSQTSNLGATDILITFGSSTCNTAGLPKTSVLKVHWLPSGRNMRRADRDAQIHLVVVRQENLPATDTTKAQQK